MEEKTGNFNESSVYKYVIMGFACLDLLYYKDSRRIMSDLFRLLL